MKLNKSILIKSIPYKINNFEINQNYTVLDELDVTYNIRPKTKTITANIKHIPATLVLALPSHYDAIEDQISLSLLEKLLVYKLGEDPQKTIDALLPYSYSRDKNGVGTVLLKLLKKYGIYISSTCRCLAYIDQMNKNGPQWCKNHFSQLLDNLKNESFNQNITFNTEIAEKLLYRAINISMKFLDKKEIANNE